MSSELYSAIFVERECRDALQLPARAERQILHPDSRFSMSALTHIGPEGRVQMVDISDKSPTVRSALASGRVVLGEEAYTRVAENTIQKGDVLAIAQFAGIMGAKETSRLIPLCHAVQLSGIDVELSLDENLFAVDVRAYAKSVGPTGVEMEALTAVSISCLTIYDMCKSVSKGIVIQDIHLLAKTGGQSGDYRKETHHN